MKQMRYFIALFFVAFTVSKITAQAPAIAWKNVYPHVPYIEYGSCLDPTDDGGYIVGSVSASHAWIFKLDADGNMEWDNYLYDDTLTGVTNVYDIMQTADGGYILAGSDFCAGWQDSIGNHGARDFMVVKLDHNGEIEWIKDYGGSSNEEAWSIDQSADGGYIVGGFSGSSDGDAAGNAPWYMDCWVIKLDADGNLLWQNMYGGGNYDYINSISCTPDGGYVFAGYSGSKDTDVTGTHWGGSDYDMWVVKLDATGNITWQNSYGGSGEDIANSIDLTNDGGYIVAGSTASHDGLVTGNHNIQYDKKDFWLIKLSSTGGLTWQKCFGGTGDDYAYSVQQTSDGGYIVGGTISPTDTNSVDITGFHGNAGTDYWIVKTDGTGNLTWQRALGGHGQEDGRTVAETSDGGYIMVGTELSNDGDVEYTDDVINGHTWVVKLGGNGAGVEESAFGNLNIYPNPANEVLNITDIPDGTTVKITDLSGQLISGSKNTGGELKLDVSAFVNGIYFIEMEHNGSVINKKIILQK